ncbi:MAG: lamin tail domain-containing protein, partial [Verrucomicrobia bacterium]|nr:lamin tail domain-containing protein [Verrucomicrobiota bacterium]
MCVLSLASAPVPFAAAAVVVSEIMYDPVGGGTNEFVELMNSGTNSVSLAGWYFADGITYTFAAGTVLPAGGYLAIAANRAAFQLRYPAVTNLAAGAFNGQLNNAGERLALADASSNIVFDVTYNNAPPWPAAAAGLGSSLVLADPAGPAGDPANWQASANLHGSPGGPGGFFVRDIVINEVLAHTDPPQEDAVELANLTTNAVNIGGWYLSDDNATRRKYRFPAGTMIAPGGHFVVYQSQMLGSNSLTPFSISAKGDDVFLSEADGADTIVRYVDQVAFEPTKNGVAVGRYPDGAGDNLIALSTPTFGVNSPATVEEFRTGTGARNAGPYVGPVVISEIMYHPVASNMAGRMEAEFVEICNRTGTNVPLFNTDYPDLTWSLTGGLNFRFPSNTVLAAGERLVVISTNALEAFRASWGLSTNALILGPFSNQLGNAGDTVRLRAPNNPEPGTNAAAYHVEDEIHYGDLLPWPLAADGFGGSLERTDVDAWGDTAANWHSSPGTATPGATNSAFVPPGAIVISEIMAVNRHTIRDEEGDFSDWIELYNTTDFPVSLAGWHLTDQAAAPDLWTFPSVTIPARGTLRVFASQKNRTNDVNYLHTNFSLDAAGEYLALFRNDLALEYAFDPAFPPQAADIAYGLPDVGGWNATAVQAGSSGRCLVPTNAAMLAADWSSHTFNDVGWLPAGNGIGYDTGPDYLPLIQTDLSDAMFGKQNSAFVRYPFVLTNSASISRLLLRVKYEDGFEAWINGVRVASNGVPAGAGWNSKATANRSETAAVVFEDYNLTAQAFLLVGGTNVLAIQALNVASNSSDLLLVAELQVSWAGATGTVATAPGYLSPGTPGSANGTTLPGFVAAPALSHPGGLFVGSLSITVTCATAGAAIRYTLDGTDPTTNSPIYSAPLNVTNDMEIVARAFLDGRIQSPTAGAVYRTSFLGINEVLASNATATPEIKDYTDYGDWIEIYNGGPAAVDLGGWHLSDNPQQPFRWQIPA